MKLNLLLLILVVSFNCSATMIDTILPVITLNGPPVIDHILNSAYVDAGAAATDDVDGNITSSIVTNINATNPDVDHSGNYTITYSVSDMAGNTGTATRLVHVYNQADFLLTSNYDGIDSCQLSPTAVFNGSITISDSINLRFAINNFGGFGSNINIKGWLVDTAVGTTIYFSAGQSLGGTAILTLGNGILISKTPGTFSVSYMWTDGINNDQCGSLYNTNTFVNVENILESSFVKIYPNPSDGVVNLESADENLLNVSVFDTRGVLIYQEKLNNISTQIDLTGKEAGIYFVRVTTSEGQQTRRIVLR